MVIGKMSKLEDLASEIVLKAKMERTENSKSKPEHL
jgi:hypothetical protein